MDQFRAVFKEKVRKKEEEHKFTKISIKNQ